MHLGMSVTVQGGEGILLSSSWNDDLGNLSLGQVGEGTIVHGHAEPCLSTHSRGLYSLAPALSGSLPTVNFP